MQSGLSKSLVHYDRYTTSEYEFTRVCSAFCVSFCTFVLLKQVNCGGHSFRFFWSRILLPGWKRHTTHSLSESVASRAGCGPETLSDLSSSSFSGIDCIPLELSYVALWALKTSSNLLILSLASSFSLSLDVGYVRRLSPQGDTHTHTHTHTSAQAKDARYAAQLGVTKLSADRTRKNYQRLARGVTKLSADRNRKGPLFMKRLLKMRNLN